MAGLDEAANVDLAKQAEELAKEAERLRQGSDADTVAHDAGDAAQKLSASIETLRRIARE
jgi:hypothetical protein